MSEDKPKSNKTAMAALIVSCFSLTVSVLQFAFNTSQAATKVQVASWVENRRVLFRDSPYLHLRITNTGAPTNIVRMGFYAPHPTDKTSSAVYFAREFASMFPKRVDRNDCFEVVVEPGKLADIPIEQRKTWLGFFVETADGRMFPHTDSNIMQMLMVEWH